MYYAHACYLCYLSLYELCCTRWLVVFVVVCFNSCLVCYSCSVHVFVRLWCLLVYNMNVVICLRAIRCLGIMYCIGCLRELAGVFPVAVYTSLGCLRCAHCLRCCRVVFALSSLSLIMFSMCVCVFCVVCQCPL